MVKTYFTAYSIKKYGAFDVNRSFALIVLVQSRYLFTELIEV